MRESAIGVFDSGIGGLSVLRHLQRLLPHEEFIYLADQAHVPYGPRTHEDIRALSEGVTRALQAQPIKLLVVACNTASAAALSYLRHQFSDLPIVGMEPAVKPAAMQTRTGKVGVLATARTFESQRYASLMARYAQEVTLYENPCRGLVELIEAGAVESEETAVLLQQILTPMITAGIDTLVLGCTHYPFVLPLLKRLLAAAPHPITIIDPAPAVARQTQRVLTRHDLLTPRTTPGFTRYLTTGPAPNLAQAVEQLLGERVAVETAVWQDGVAKLQSGAVAK
ncbi:MAG: glutamate racemase [Chloroflexota bacterium]|jgi:glutamate racemase